MCFISDQAGAWLGCHKQGPFSLRPATAAIAIRLDYLSSLFVFLLFFAFLPPNYISASSFPYFITAFSPFILCSLAYLRNFFRHFLLAVVHSSFLMFSPFQCIYLCSFLLLVYLQVYQTTELTTQWQVNGSMKQSPP